MNWSVRIGLLVLPGTRLLGYNKGKGKTKQFKALYVLAKQSVQRPDPVVPG